MINLFLNVVRGKDDISNDDSLDMNSFIAEVSVQMLKHTMGMLLTTEGVGLVGFNRSSHCSNSLLDIGIDELINLTDIGGQLLNIVFLLGEFHKEGETDRYVGVVKGEDLIVGALVYEILHRDKIFSLSPWQAPK